LRCPIIPTANFTDAHFKSIVRLVQETESVREVHLLPYHPLGIEKSKRLGKIASFNDQNFLNAELLQNYAKQIATEA
jgi:pyruvate formate lyase activating enzyme